MSDEIDKLNEIASFFRRMNSKVMLLRLLNKAKTEYDKCNFSAGRSSLEQALAIEPNNAVALRGLGSFELFEKKYESAIEFYNKALEYSENKEIEYTLIGMVYYFQDKLDEAVKNFNLAIDSNENYSAAYESRNQAMLESHLKIIDLQDSLKKYF